MPASTNRRRFLAFVALFASAPLRSVLAQSDAPPPPTPDASTRDVKDFGSWRVESQYNTSQASIPIDRMNVTAGLLPTNPATGGVVLLDMGYSSVPGDDHGLKGRMVVSRDAAPGTPPFPTEVIADGRKIAVFETSDQVTYDLAAWFGPDLADLANVQNIKVVMTIDGKPLVIYDVDLSGTADAIAALPVIPDYNYAYRTDQAPSSTSGGTAADLPDDCFLTTACCGVVGLADDCAELTTLRAFRDRVMLATPEGRADVARYYQIAPAILAEMKRRGDERVLLRLYFTTILPAVLAARVGLNGVARHIYTAMMAKLEARYARGCA